MDLRILIVEDSALFRAHLTHAIRAIDGCNVVGFADDGVKAIEQVRALQPDIVTLDIEMPRLNGLEVLKQLKAEGIPSKVIMVSRLTNAGAQETTDALLSGAFDFILKPHGADPVANRQRLVDDLREKIQAVRTSLEDNLLREKVDFATTDHPRIYNERAKEFRPSHFDCVVIGCSTGGPDALARIIPMLPPQFPTPLLIVQHMPVGFTKSLAKRLDEASEIRVVEAESGMGLESGKAFLAPGGFHLGLVSSILGPPRLIINEDPKVNNCRPAVDYTLKSAIGVFGKKVLAVILTGMGRDGLEGCRELSALGGCVVTQSPERCVVYGMPKVVTQAGLANIVAPIDGIAKAMTRVVTANR